MDWKAEIRKEELKLLAAGETRKTVLWRSFYTSGFSAQCSLIVAKTSKEVAFTFSFCFLVSHAKPIPFFSYFFYSSIGHCLSASSCGLDMFFSGA